MFVIKHNGMYFQGFKDYSFMEGYLDKKHPKRTLKYCKNQHQAMEFISYEKAHDFKYKNNVLGTVTLIQETSNIFNIDEIIGYIVEKEQSNGNSNNQ